MRQADCERCPTCGSEKTSIIYRRLLEGWIYERRHACQVGDKEKACERWNSYQSLLDPRKVKQRPISSPPVEIRDASL